MYKLAFTIHDLPKTYNAINRRHYHAKTAEKNKWLHLVHLSTRGKVPDAPLKHYKLHLVRCSSSIPDYDGLVISFKHVVDALIECKVIANDRLSNSGPWQVEWMRGEKKKGYIRVTVTELQKPPMCDL